MKPKNFDVQIIIDCLRGTSQTLEQTIEGHYPEMNLDDLSDIDLDNIDSEIFCCACCGWWCDNDEKSEKIEDENVCQDCEDDY